MIPSVVVHYLDVSRPHLTPLEAEAPLVIDADAVLTLAIALQSLQVVARRSFQEFQRLRSIELSELAHGDADEGLEATRVLALEECKRVFALERLDHAASMLRAA